LTTSYLPLPHLPPPPACLQALANSVWALGKLGVPLPPALLRQLLQASYKDMYSFTLQVRVHPGWAPGAWGLGA